MPTRNLNARDEREVIFMSGRTVIVTGSSGQLGSAICSAIKNKGIETVGLDSKSGLHTSEVIDLSIQDRSFFEEVVRKTSCTTIINNAGIAIFDDPTSREWLDAQRLFRLNYFVPQSFMNAALRVCSRCRVINVGSIYGHRAADQSIYVDSDRSSSEIYGSSKAALIFLTRYYASRFGSESFQFNSVSPGGVWADIPGQSEAFRTRYSDKVPLKRMADSNEIAETVAWLGLDAPNYLNGQDILVDGGYSAR